MPNGTPDPSIAKEWLTAEEVGIWLDVSPGLVCTWVRDGLLPGLKVRSVVRVRLKALEEFVLEHSTL